MQYNFLLSAALTDKCKVSTIKLQNMWQDKDGKVELSWQIMFFMSIKKQQQQNSSQHELALLISVSKETSILHLQLLF